jgi:hypothetical protein
LFQSKYSLNIQHRCVLATLFVAIISIVACQNYEPESFTVAVEALTQPNQYQTHLKWNVNDDEGEHWVIQRQSEKEPAANVGTVSHEAKDYIDTTVVAGTTYRYTLASTDSESFTVKKSLDVTVPRDLTVTGVTALPSVTGIGRLIIPKGSKIVTNGKDIEISVDQIISDGGTLETFPEGQTAAQNTPGRSGGQVKLRAKSGTGVLTVIARGETGGASTTVGPQGAPGPNGIPGLNANCGYKDNDQVCGIEPSEYQQIVDKCKQGGIFNDIWCKVLQNFYCKMQPGNGGQGVVGFPGGQGGPGFNGGDSGNILVEIADPTNIQINPVSVAGEGGLGGPGGPGGAGGQGGSPGQSDRLHICTGVALPGPQGPLGPTGLPGITGVPGVKGPLCLKLGPNSAGDCSKF